MSSLLASRLGLSLEGAPGLDDLQRQLTEGGARWRRRLRAPELPAPEAPASTLEALQLAVADARQRGHDAWADALLEHHLELIPSLLLQQQTDPDPALRQLWDTPTRLAEWPGLGPALERLSALLDAAKLPQATCPSLPLALGAAPLALGADLYPLTCFGRSLPMLLLYGARPAAILARCIDAQDRCLRMDRWLAGAWLHELAHLGRRRDALFPFLDEAVAGYLGTRLLPEAVLAPPERPSPLVGWMPFVCIGQAMARLFGLERLVQAQAGALPWDALLGPGLREAAERLWWAEHQPRLQVSLHPDTARPGRWLKLLELGARGAPLDDLTWDALDALPLEALGDRPDLHPDEPALEEEALRFALGAAALRHSGDAAGGLAALGLPATLRLALEDGEVVGAARAPLPPRLTARLRAAGLDGRRITLEAPGDLADAAAALMR